MKSKIICVILVVIVLLLGGCQTSKNADAATKDDYQKSTNVTANHEEIKIIDDMGETVTLDKPAQKVISLYSVHTENIYSLGAQDQLIGVSTSVKYPEEALEKKQYSYKDDAEVIIAANPDLVIIRTMIARRYSDFVDQIKEAGIPVVTLYCSKFEEFDEYIENLGVLLGKEAQAEKLINDFNGKIKEIEKKVENVEPKNVYFESIGKKFKTATPDSFAGHSLTILNVNNIAADVEYDGTSTVVDYGEENLLSKASEIDYYIAQNGVMNRGVTVESIKKRPGYDVIKAVQEDHLYVIEGKRISGATMRYIDGLQELMYFIHGVK